MASTGVGSDSDSGPGLGPAVAATGNNDAVEAPAAADVSAEGEDGNDMLMQLSSPFSTSKFVGNKNNKT